jgi:hypothetical protein
VGGLVTSDKEVCQLMLDREIGKLLAKQNQDDSS